MDVAAVFSANVGRAIAHQGLNIHSAARAWSVKHKTLEAVVKRLRVPTLTTAQEIAKGAGYTLWQLLSPDFDPANPPVMRIVTPAEAEFYDRLKQMAATLPSPAKP